ncbi:12222_t:CDS:1 [Cetraspora pellucida]|uniref:12222_t:CDS:1 n=1 Tax=Cetraspora pellucida TaxID=1433469 RepID=A0ACA9K8J9_9GLOM|nr:12222_t:CDS:1 [Cetraspora pellucida]
MYERNTLAPIASPSNLTSSYGSRSRSVSPRPYATRNLCPSPRYHPEKEDPIRNVVDNLIDSFSQLRLECTTNEKIEESLVSLIYNNREQPSSIYCWLSDNQNTLSYGTLLGFFLLIGIGCEKDEKRAFTLFLTAAKRDYLVAQEFIGHCYFYGIGTHKEENLAFNWYSKCAKQESACGYYGLGRCYEYGKGTDRCLIKAYECYRTSAEGGNVCGMNDLARYYRDGIGHTRNLNKAIRWYRKALNHRCEEAQSELDILLDQNYN